MIALVPLCGMNLRLERFFRSILLCALSIAVALTTATMTKCDTELRDERQFPAGPGKDRIIKENR